MMKHILLAMLVSVVILFCPKFSHAAPRLILDLANDHVDITTGFNGETIYIHGYIGGIEKDISDLGIAIVLKGPKHKMVVRRKERLLGMWMNLDSISFQGVYSFYDFASSVPDLSNITSASVLTENNIGLNYLEFETTHLEKDVSTKQAFHEALIRSKQSMGLYAISQKDIDFIDGPFFRTEFRVPANVKTGPYNVTGYLFQGQDIVSTSNLELTVEQVGFNARVFEYSQNQSLLYGLTAILIALILGWSASAFLRQD